MKKQKTEQTRDNALLNVIAPMSIEVKATSLRIGDNVGKGYGIIKYPQQLDYGWLGKITNIPGTITSITYRQIESSTFLESLSANINRYNMIANTAKSPLEQSRAEQIAIDSNKIMRQIDQSHETVGLLTVSILCISDEEHITDAAKKMVSSCAMLSTRPRCLANLQKECFKQTSPFFNIDPDIEQVAGRIVPFSTFAGGVPFASSGFYDEDGYIIGKDGNGGLVVISIWKRGNDRTNTNMVIMGAAGVGKSTFVKLIGVDEWLNGTKVIFIDPEREYRELCKNINGDWINAGGGVGGKINPLEIRPVPPDDDEDEEKLYGTNQEVATLGAKALHLKTLEVFIELYKSSLTQFQKDIVKDLFIELYDQFNIFWDTDTSQLTSNDYPIFEDFYQLILSKKEVIFNDPNSSMLMKDTYEQLGVYFKDIALGTDSHIWNGHTNIQTTSRCICLDTHDLQGASDSTKSTQYFNILTWAWQQMISSRDERVILVCDEAYLMIDKNVPQSLAFLRNAEKRARKFEAAVVIVSHSVVDFLDPAIKMFGQALLDIPCIKVLMGTDGKNLQETKELYNLTEAEEELLAGKIRQEALLMVGNKRLRCTIEVSDKKLELFGKAGGR